jgi:hypothetical protein
MMATRSNTYHECVERIWIEQPGRTVPWEAARRVAPQGVGDGDCAVARTQGHARGQTDRGQARADDDENHDHSGETDHRPGHARTVDGLSLLCSNSQLTLLR